MSLSTFLVLLLTAQSTSAAYSALYYEYSGCSTTASFESVNMPINTCVWTPRSVGSILTFDGWNMVPEFYAVGPASGDRADYIYGRNGLRGCGNYGGGVATGSVDQDSGVCTQRAEVAGVTFSGCINYAQWQGHCAGWHFFTNCGRAPSVIQCDKASANPGTFAGSGNVSGYSRTELRKRGSGQNNTMAQTVFDIIDAAKGTVSCFNEYSDVMITKDHPRAVDKYCNGTDHVVVFDQGTVITRFNDEECV